jgi:SHS2 domain-containing protein
MKRPDLNYRLIDHTADLGIQVAGADPAALFGNAALAMMEQIIDLQSVRAVESIHMSVEGSDWPDLMVNWLREILYLWNGREMLPVTITIADIDASGLKARIGVEPYNPDRHHIRQEIKAVTYHHIRVARSSGSWEAIIIFDV